MASCVHQLEFSAYINSVGQTNCSSSDFMRITSPSSVGACASGDLDRKLSQRPYRDFEDQMSKSTTPEVPEMKGSKPTPLKPRRKIYKPPKARSQKRICRLETLPGTSLKICENCSTVAETAKAKKCHNCQKFFYDHWAQRCRIPPCPKCHFSRRSRAREKPPYKCDRCGYDLSGETQTPLEEEEVVPSSLQGTSGCSVEDAFAEEASSTRSELIPTVLSIIKMCGKPPSSVDTEERSDSTEMDDTVTESDDQSVSMDTCDTPCEHHLEHKEPPKGFPLVTLKQSKELSAPEKHKELPQDPKGFPLITLKQSPKECFTSPDTPASLTGEKTTGDPPTCSTGVHVSPVDAEIVGSKGPSINTGSSNNRQKSEIKTHHTPSIVTVPSCTKTAVAESFSPKPDTSQLARSSQSLTPVSTVESLATPYSLGTIIPMATPTQASIPDPTPTQASLKNESVPPLKRLPASTESNLSLLDTMNSLFTFTSAAITSKKQQDILCTDSMATSSISTPSFSSMDTAVTYPSMTPVTASASPPTEHSNQDSLALVNTMPTLNSTSTVSLSSPTLSVSLSESLTTPPMQPAFTAPSPRLYTPPLILSTTSRTPLLSEEKYFSTSEKPVTPVIVPSFQFNSLSNNQPTIKKIQELVEMTLKQKAIPQYQTMAQKQQKMLFDQLQAQIEIQRNLLSSRVGGESSDLGEEIPGKKKRYSSDNGGPATKRSKVEKVPVHQLVAEVLQRIGQELDKSQGKSSNASCSLKGVEMLENALNRQPSPDRSSAHTSPSSLPPGSDPVVSSPPNTESGALASTQSSFRKIDVNSSSGNDKIRVCLLNKSSTSPPTITPTTHVSVNSLLLPSPNLSSITPQTMPKSDPFTSSDSANTFAPSLSTIQEEPSALNSQTTSRISPSAQETLSSTITTEEVLKEWPDLKIIDPSLLTSVMAKQLSSSQSTLATKEVSVSPSSASSVITSPEQSEPASSATSEATVSSSVCIPSLLRQVTATSGISPPNRPVPTGIPSLLRPGRDPPVSMKPTILGNSRSGSNGSNTITVSASNNSPKTSPAALPSSSTESPRPNSRAGLVTVQVCNPSTLPSEVLAAIGGVPAVPVVQNVEPPLPSPDPTPPLRGGRVIVSVLGRSVPLAGVKGQDTGSTSQGGVEDKSPTCAPAESNRSHKKSGHSSNSGSIRRGGGATEGGGAGGGESCEEDEEGEEDDMRGNKDRKKKRKQPKSSPSKKNSVKVKQFSVKLKDGFFHHAMWDQHRVVFIVPLLNGEIKDTVLGDAPNGSVKTAESSSKGAGKNTPTPGSDRKTRRKAKLEPMDVHEMEEDMDLLEPPPTSSAHIHTPCFSIPELRHKPFSELPPNTIYAYCYRHQIKSIKPPLHWHQVLKRMGGVQLSSNTCRILEVKHIQRMVDHYTPDTPLPSCLLQDFSRNKLPKGRQVIDLSDIDPEDLLSNPEHLDEIPQCSSIDSKRKSSKKSIQEDIEPSVGASKSCDQSPDQETKSHDRSHDSQDEPVFQEDDPEEKEFFPGRRSSPSISSKSKKKKFCPQCGVQIARKSKKCYECGKRFGVFSFGRKLCPACGRCNLAKMAACFGCGHTLAAAQTAIPDALDETTTLHQRTTFPFGSRKRPRDGFGEEGKTKIRKEQHFSMSSSAPSSRRPSTADTEGSIEEEVGVATPKEEEPTTPNKAPSIQKPSKFTGYQYGRIPWGDADVTCLVDESGTAKFCLPELCTKVFRGHSKSDVFDIVKDLHLPLVQGDMSLLKKLQALGLHSNRSPMCRIIGPDELWTLLDALQEQVPAEVHQHLESIAGSSRPLALTESPGCPIPPIPALIAADTTLQEDDEHGFESTLHEVECSDGQRIALLRTWQGEQYGSLTEIWRKYFPEVNRNHLTSVLKRLKLETSMPTGQQATLLRNANVISVRGAAGRLMKLEDLQLLLDDLSIPLQIGSTPGPSIKRDKPAPAPPSQLSMAPPPASKPRKNSTYGLSTLAASAAAHGKVLATKEDLEYAQCMRNLLKAIEIKDLHRLLQENYDNVVHSFVPMDSDLRASYDEWEDAQQHIMSQRELCGVLTDEIGFLNVTNHGRMSEVVRLTHTEKSVLQDLDKLCKTHNLQPLFSP